MGRPMDTNLDARKRIFEFIVDYKRAHDGNSPTSREIVEGAGISSTSVVHYHLGALEREGKIRLGDSKSRRIEVVGGEWQWHEEYLTPNPFLSREEEHIDNL